MAFNTKNFLDKNGIFYLWDKIANIYVNNEDLTLIIEAIDETKADKDEILTMDEIYNEIINRLPIAEDGAY